MANEIVFDADAALTAALERMIVMEARPGLTILEYFDIKSIEGEPTLALKTVKHPTTANAAAVTDGTELTTNTALNPTSVTQTTSGVALVGVVTDFSQKGSLITYEEAAANFGRALANKIDVDTTALLASFSNTAGASGVDATVANFLTLIFNLENADETKGPMVAALHPIQIFDLRSAVVAAGGTVFGNDMEAPLGGFLKLMPGSNPNYKGTLFGVPIIASSNVPTANAGADRAGALFAVKRALKFVWKWAPTVETRREPRYIGDLLVVHACYNAAEIVDGAGSSLITDA